MSTPTPGMGFDGSPGAGPGVLHITFLYGTMSRNTEMFGQMDPYMVVTLNGNKKYRTRPCDNGGLNPKWNETLEINIASPLTDEIMFSCHDKDLIYDDFIG